MFRVMTKTICGGWDDCWTDEEHEPTRFKTSDEAQAAIDELIEDTNEAVKNGDMDGAYSPDDYKIEEVNETI